jgi:membrane associated rhomboid family serine protease
MTEGRPKLCWNCRKLIGLDTVCPYCGAKQGKASAARATSTVRNLKNRSAAQLLTYFCGFIFLLTLLASAVFFGPAAFFTAIMSPPDPVLQLLGLNTFGLDSSRWWTLVTGCFLHYGLFHFGFNMYGFYTMGQLLEPLVGKRTYWIFFMLAALGGAFLTSFMGHASLGASNGIFGIMGAAIIISFVLGEGTRDPIFRQLVFWGLFSLSMGFMPGSRFDNWGHIGGLTSGLGLGLVWVSIYRKRYYPALSTALTWLLIAGVIACYAAGAWFIVSKLA